MKHLITLFGAIFLLSSSISIVSWAESPLEDYKNKCDKSNKSTDCTTALYVAVSAGDMEKVKLLIELEVDINTLLHFATLDDNTELIEFLIELGAVEVTGELSNDKPLYTTINYNETNTFKPFIANIADDIEGQYGFYTTSNYNETDAVKPFIANEVDDIEGQYGFHVTNNYRNMEADKFFIELRANINTKGHIKKPFWSIKFFTQEITLIKFQQKQN